MSTRKMSRSGGARPIIRSARSLGIDTRTIYYDVAEIPQEDRERLNAEPVGFEELLAESDLVTLHVPLNRQTRKMISDRELGLMKESAYLINACRGPVVDEQALHRALTQGVIAGAGLDVLEEEPTPMDNPLFDLDNVIISPHQAGYSQETNYRATCLPTRPRPTMPTVLPVISVM